MIEIQPGLTYLTRTDWGARTDIPRLGYPVNRLDRTEAIMHHTVIIDVDATPNRWGTMAQVKAKMRQLQTIRPDLGLDVPYNDVAFHMEDGSLVICEGRGFDRTGAHTHGHNTRGMATAGQGNFQVGQAVDSYADHWSRWWGYQKYDMGMENLGSSHPARGIAYGHKDFIASGCPGDNLYAIIPQLTFKEGAMTDAEFLKQLTRVLSKAQVVATLADGTTKQSRFHALGWWINLLRKHNESTARHAAGGVSRATAKADALAIAKAEDAKLKVTK